LVSQPAELSRGRGIFIFQTLTDLNYDRACVVQAYLERPLTLMGYKFDLRLYVLVTSFKPLTVYMYKKGMMLLTL
jgi:tubulin polyglutamylase TTLL2